MTKNSAAALAEFKKVLHRLSYRHSYADTLTHFVDFALYMLDPNKNRDNVDYLLSYYTAEEGQLMAAMFKAWTEAADNDGSGFKDIFGDIFMEYVSNGRNGQFFTPEHLCELMAMLTMATGGGKKVVDPCCGSGRMLLAAARINRCQTFYGADNDLLCCKMAALNLICNTMPGEIAYMDSLSLEYYYSYHIQLRVVDGVYIPYYHKSTDKSKSHFFK